MNENVFELLKNKKLSLKEFNIPMMQNIPT
jgi:hypothetical protein